MSQTRAGFGTATPGAITGRARTGQAGNDRHSNDQPSNDRSSNDHGEVRDSRAAVRGVRSALRDSCRNIRRGAIRADRAQSSRRRDEPRARASSRHRRTSSRRQEPLPVKFQQSCVSLQFPLCIADIESGLRSVVYLRHGNPLVRAKLRGARGGMLCGAWTFTDFYQSMTKPLRWTCTAGASIEASKGRKKPI
jgi:hypothetical protein